MSNVNKYSPKDLAEFESVVTTQLSKLEDEKKLIDKRYEEQKSYLGKTNRGIANSSQYMTEKAMLDKLNTRLEQKINSLRSALQRIENGTYGICTDTGRLISKERLLARPMATRSIEAV